MASRYCKVAQAECVQIQLQRPLRVYEGTGKNKLIAIIYVDDIILISGSQKLRSIDLLSEVSTGEERVFDGTMRQRW